MAEYKKDLESPQDARTEVIDINDVKDKEMMEITESAMDAEIQQFEQDLQNSTTKIGGRLFTFNNPAVFTYVLVAFASMGGLLSGLDQSLISGANLYMPDDLNLNSNQASLVNSGMPLGAVGGALLLSPVNEYLGRRWAIIVSCILYTIGAGLEAGAMNFGMMVAGRVVLGMGVGLEGGTVPVYVAECGT